MIYKTFHYSRELGYPDLQSYYNDPRTTLNDEIHEKDPEEIFCNSSASIMFKDWVYPSGIQYDRFWWRARNEKDL